MIKKSILLILICFLYSGCEQIIPKIELRDNYQGKRLIEPNSQEGYIYRDNLGNPVLNN